MQQISRSLALFGAGVVLAFAPILGGEQPPEGDARAHEPVSFEIENRAIGLRARLRFVEARLAASSGHLSLVPASPERSSITSKLERLDRSLRRIQARLSSLRADSTTPERELQVDRLRELDLAIRNLERDTTRVRREINFLIPIDIGAADFTRLEASMAPTGTGSISGLVTDSVTTAPIELTILVFDANDAFVTFTFTEPDGTYVTDEVLGTGSYYVATQNSIRYIDEVYDDVRCPYFICFDRTIGDLVAVVDGQATTEIDFQLDPGGVIAGTVSDQAGSPLSGAQVQVFDSNGRFIASAISEAGSSYRTNSGLPTGDYFAVARLDGYVDHLYWGFRCLGTCVVTDGTPIPVDEASRATTFAHFQLELGGTISGAVTDQVTGSPITDGRVEIYRTNGQLIYWDALDSAGVWDISRGIPEGFYVARTFNSLHYFDEIYDNIPCAPGCDPTAGSFIWVAAGGSAPGIDFALAPGGAIAGNITDAASASPLADVSVSIYDASGDLLDEVLSDALGDYESERALAAGSHFAATYNEQSYFDELYDDLPCHGQSCDPTTGTPIVATPGTITGGIDFGLDLGGRISGTVAGGTVDTPLEDVQVDVVDDQGYWMGSTVTDSSGFYRTTSALATGDYFLNTENRQGFLDELWDDHLCWPYSCNDPATGDPVAVTAPNETENIDFVLDPGGKISGTLTEAATGAPLANAWTWIYTATNYPLFSGIADASGFYTSEAGLIAGTYFVRTGNRSGYLNEAWDNIPCPSCNVTTSTPIDVTLGVTASGIDFALEEGGVITGTITDQSTGAPLPDISVEVHDDSGDHITWGWSGVDGVYSTALEEGLESGSYRAVAWFTGAYARELFDDLPCVGACDVIPGTPIPVTLGATTASVDFDLELGGGISGTVTDSVTGTPLFTPVGIYDPAGNWLHWADTDATGYYETTEPFPSGDYRVRAISDSNGYLGEIWDDIPCHPWCDFTIGDAVVVATGTMTPGIDFGLDLGGAISGVVTAEGTGAPITQGSVRIYDAAGNLFTTANLDASGAYTTELGLLSGTYYAKSSNTEGFLDELYDDLPCHRGCDVTLGAPIIVTPGTTSSGVDFSLIEGGAINGAVTDATTPFPIEGIAVYIFDDTGVNIDNTTTDMFGFYQLEPLMPGDYFAVSYNEQSYFDELYDDLPCPDFGCDPTTGTPIPVSAGVTSGGIDFQLVRGGAVSGRVTAAATGQPLSSARVDIFDPGGDFVTQGWVFADGNYTTNQALAAGTYFARVFNFEGFIDEVYDNVSCAFDCNPTTGTPIVVTAGATTSGIDFALELPGRISGTITDNTTDAPIQGVRVYIYDASGNEALVTETDATGGYATLLTIPAGSYYARTRNDDRYLNELWDDLPCFPDCDVTTGTPIIVTSGATTSGVDFDLLLGGSISGIVTDESTGSPLIGGQVHIYDASGTRLMTSFYDVDGTYATTAGLPGGSYFARVLSLTSHIDELYHDIPCIESCDPTTGTPIPVALAANTGGIDFALAPGGGLSGTVTDGTTGAPLELIEMEVFDAGGAYVTTTWTDATGLFHTEWGVLGGIYFVVARDTASSSYVTELYDDIPCPLSCDVTAGAPIAVTLGVTTSGIDFQLEQGGHVSGQVTDESTGDPIANSWVYIYDAAGIAVSTGLVDATGHYATEQTIPVGTFYAQVFNNLSYLNELWDGVQCNFLCEDPSVGTPISVTSGAVTPGIDFTLGIGGTMTGTLIDLVTGAPLTSGEVEVFDASGTYRGRGVPNGSGSFTTYPGLFSGTYHVRTHVGGGYVEELFDDILCPDSSCDPTVGDPISVTLGSATPGIDFALDSSFFSDGFESGDLSAWDNSIP